ncbi:hypothetical protein IX307_001152 [Bacteroides pyogenes]|uniref:Uncharacterized protein n=1 Tax=Bacteroides pyogenes F0041 TaxID=1321819 RepID=U2DIY9_9BACE|nr:hypothetical protein [Bacteroides pyogenes]ERI81462.1 hypothetical protein HMPREF1981_03226 [Bacteroides pyogenes F0041]MBR8719961.1 hypothetical protein [Bacteroides pyogenes]MBR8786838.1 hypothetical protein [Bacteroides pyogenes]MBR8792323.1 hypothetical protein [Bacteroides pyogenes]
MYVDVDSRGRLSVHDIRPDEALLLAGIIRRADAIIENESIRRLGKQLLIEAVRATENTNNELYQ